MKIGHLYDFTHLAQYALLAAAHNELTLMGRYGAKSATTKTATMQAHTVFDHIVGWNAMAAILRVRQTRIGQIKTVVNFLGAERRERRIYYHALFAHLLQNTLRLPAVALLWQHIYACRAGFLRGCKA